MKKNLCLFEDQKYENLLPLVFTRPVYDLRCGILTLREKINYYLPNYKFSLHTRKILHNVVQERNPKFNVNNFGNEETLFVNGRLLADKLIAKEIKKLEPNSALLFNEELIAANVGPQNVQKIFKEDSEFLQFENCNLAIKEISAKLVNYPWDLVNMNGSQIKADYSLIVKEATATKKYSSVEYANKKDIYVAKDAKVDPFVHLDASSGPIYISKNVHIMSHSLVQGPAFIGEGTVVKAHSAIYHDTSVGEVCKVGGEIEASIIHSYSNKQHEGFLGHAYLGSWVNLGADTNNSDLKNNYSSVSVLIKGKNVDTKSQFVGLIMGDHSKTAINTMFNTGTIVGIFSNIFGAGFPPRYIPSYSWGGSDFLRNYDIEKCIEVARVVLNRRMLRLTYAEEELLRNIYELTKPEKVKKA